MRIFYKIIIILFILTTLFILKEDVVSVLGNINSYFDKNTRTPIINLTVKESVLPSKIDMPGALRVVDNLLNINNVELSKNNIIILTNKYRKENGGLIALQENNKLNLSAEKKIKDMFADQYFEHMSKSGEGVGDLGEEVGYEYILIGENLAMGNFNSDQALIDAWIASVGHRENIVNDRYTEIGVAVGRGKFEGKDIWMAVQHFGTPRSVCPSIDSVLYTTITLNQNKMKEMEDDLTTRLDMINKGVVYKGMTHNEQITEYNNLLNPYNNLIKDIRDKINIYNEQVRAFNVCLLSQNEE